MRRPRRRDGHRPFAPRLAASLVGLLLAGLLVVGCRSEEPTGATVVDLVAELPHARSATTRARVRLADPQNGDLLRGGWNRNAAADGAFLWALGPRAGVDVFVDRVVDRTLRLRCAGVALPPGEAPRLTLRIAGEAVGSQPLPPPGEPQPIDFEVPAAGFELGVNRLELEVSRWHDPSNPADGVVDDRPLGARCEALEMVGAVASVGAPHRETVAERQRLVLPAGSGVRYFLEPPAGARLELSGVERSGATLALRVVDETGRIVVETDVRGGGSWPLGDTSTRLRIDLVAAPEPDSLGGVFTRWFDDTDAPRVLLERAHVLRGGRVAAAGGAAGAAHEERVPAPEEPPEEIARAAGSDSPAGSRAPVSGVLVYLIDTVRADHLGLYGYHRPTSPELEKLAREGITFTEARAQTSWTRTAVASIFTGRLPSGHGVDDRDDVLSDDLVTLAEVFDDAGWTTVGVVTNGNAGPRFGFAQGFDAYQHLRESFKRREVHHLADDVNSWILTWLDGYLASHGGSQGGAAQGDPPPFFLYAHATDPHAPYTPRPPFDDLFAAGVDPTLGELATVREITSGKRTVTPEERDGLVDLYDGELAFVDREIGRLVDLLRDRGVFDDLLLVIVSDHGEEFLEHGGWEHGKTLYEEQLRVPLVIKLPGAEAAGLRIDGRADHVDLLPTVLDVVGLEPPAGLDGQSLLPAVRAVAAGRKASERWPSIAELRLGEDEQLSLVDGDEKVIVEQARGARFFALDADPAELDDRGVAEPFAAGVLEERLRRHLAAAEARRPQPVETELDPETREQLEALGYVQ
ncbi:MAG: sulfatase [Acidobacteriota bacterium]